MLAAFPVESSRIIPAADITNIIKNDKKNLAKTILKLFNFLQMLKSIDIAQLTNFTRR